MPNPAARTARPTTRHPANGGRKNQVFGSVLDRGVMAWWGRTSQLGAGVTTPSVCSYAEPEAPSTSPRACAVTPRVPARYWGLKPAAYYSQATYGRSHAMRKAGGTHVREHAGDRELERNYPECPGHRLHLIGEGERARNWVIRASTEHPEVLGAMRKSSRPAYARGVVGHPHVTARSERVVQEVYRFHVGAIAKLRRRGARANGGL